METNKTTDLYEKMKKWERLRLAIADLTRQKRELDDKINDLVREMMLQE